ncbi:MAG: PucR family transcriptional regulator ligand-binding domain-containing protein, partial [Pyramidobacter sp.]
MHFTVRELLKMEECLASQEAVNIVAGNDGLDNEIKGVTIIEAPDIVKFILGGEVLLTGLYAFKSCSLDEFESCIAQLKETHVAAIFLKEGRNIEQAEEKTAILKAYCDDTHIPLVTVPFRLSFQVIMRGIMGRLFNKEIVKLKYYKTTRDNFTALYSNPLPDKELPYKIIDMLDKMIRNPVAVFDRNRLCLASTSPKHQQLIYDKTSKRIDPGFITQYRYYESTGEEHAVVVELPLSTGQLFFLQVVEKISELTDMDLIAIENAVIALQIEFFKQHSI